MNNTNTNGGFNSIHIEPSPLIRTSASTTATGSNKKYSTNGHSSVQLLAASTEPDPDDDPDSDYELLNEFNINKKNADDIYEDKKNKWIWRIAKYAIPVQLALVALFCAACFLEPHCCDTLNNLSMSFTPQLRYVRGPPPI